jgi:hypothetical protein
MEQRNMPMRSGLAAYLFVGPPVYGSPIVQEVGSMLDNLTLSTISPGGFGTLTALLRVRSAKVQRPQFGMFARIAVMDGLTPVWLGELLNPAYGISQSDGEYIKLSALGLGNGLRDNPNSWTFTSQTAQQIAQFMLTQHTSTTKALTGILSTDATQLFPDNPVNPITQVYMGRTMEEVLADAALLVGDYNWGVEADPIQKDFAGFPLGRVFARARALASVDYMAKLTANDIYTAEFTPTADRAYNQIEVDYNNGTTGVGVAKATDTRLNADLSQGLAPWRFRKYLRDLSGTGTVNGTIAQSVANTQLGLFQNPTYTGTATLRGIRDSNGARMPLWQAQAGRNLYVPEMAIQGAQLPTAPTQNVNLFWITQATYREDSTGNQQMDLNLGYLPDSADVQVARLQMAADALNRGSQVASVVQALGAPMRGQYAIGFSGGIAGQNTGSAVEFPALAYQAPTSLTLTSTSSSNLGAVGVTDLTAVGAYLFATISANGAGFSRGTYKTNGNCLLAVDAESGRFAHHCDECDHAHHDLAVDEESGHVVVHRSAGHVGLTVICPRCAGRTMEAFHCGLTERDEAGPYAHRAQQARLIRALMAAHGMALA